MKSNKTALYLMLWHFYAGLSLCRPMDSSTTVAEEFEYLNNRLNYQNKRLLHIRRNLPDEPFIRELDMLIERFENALLVENVADKVFLLENYAVELEPVFSDFLQEKIDEQYLNEEILIEAWYLQQLMPQLKPQLADEVLKNLPKYWEALESKSLDQKYDLFADIAESFSRELLDILEKEPEREVIIKAHIQFFHKYVLYLQGQSSSTDYEPILKQLLQQLEQALSPDSSSVTKERVLARFDDNHTRFGRYLSWKINEFELDNFSL